MYLRYLCFPINVLGPGKRIGLWLTGCSKNCPGCMSVELRQRREDDEVSLVLVEQAIERCARKGASGITISGGEPFDQAEELALLVEWCEANITRDILVYTGYTQDELVGIRGARDVLAHIATLIDGPYVAELDDGIGARGSANQRVIDLCDLQDQRSCQNYDYEGVARERQAFHYGDHLFIAGLDGGQRKGSQLEDSQRKGIRIEGSQYREVSE